jgi:site-specific DNA recombinase
MKAVIYSRVSTLDQDNRRQIAELKDYAKYRKFDLLKVFEEKITGASKAAERSEFKKLLEFIEKGKVDYVLVWELSRLGRSMLDVLNTIELFSQKGINIYIKKEGINTLDDKGQKSTMTNIIISILSGFSEMERETIRQRSISGIRHNVSTGGSGTGIIKAYGFDKVEKKLVINEEEAEIIKLIFKKYLGGLGTGQIAEFLNNKGIKTKYNKLFGNKQIQQRLATKKGSDFNWKDGTVYTMLKNTIYKGERTHRGEIFKVPAIINPEIFDRVQLKLKASNNKKDNTTVNDNLLKGLLICGKCGQSYFMHKRKNNKDAAYKCISKRYKNPCGNPSINIDKLVKSLYITCADMINSDEIKKVSESVSNRIDNKRIEISNQKKSIESLTKKIDRLLELKLSGKITIKVFTSKNRELNDQLVQSENRLDKMRKELSDLETIANNSTSATYNEKNFKTYLNDVVQTIKVYELPFNNSMREGYSEKDTLVLIDIKSKLDWINDSPIERKFVISRFSKNLGTIHYKSERELFEKGKYSLDFFHNMDEWQATQLKNDYMKLKGSKKAMKRKDS